MLGLSPGRIGRLGSAGPKAGGGVLPVIWDVAALSPRGWYDAADPASIVATAGAVDTWKNKGSAVGSDATAAGTARPTTGTRTQNGKNALDFDGVNNIMTIAGDMLNIAAGPNTVIAFVLTDGGASYRVIAGTTTGSRWSILLNASATVGRLDEISNPASTLLTSTGRDLVGAMSVAMRASGITGLVSAFVNGLRPGQTAARADVTATAMRIAGSAINSSDRFDGLILEIVAFDRLLSIDELAKVAGYGRAKWGLKALSAPLDEWATDDPRTVFHGQNIVAWGSSTTEGVGSTSPATQSYGAVIATQLNRRYSNGGVAGNTSAMINTRVVADDQFRDRITIFQFGANNTADSAGTIAALQTSIATLGSNTKFVLLPPTPDNNAAGYPGGADRIGADAIRDWMLANYPANTCDVRTYMVGLGAPGQPYASATDYANGVNPTALRYDTAHINDLGHSLYGAFIANFIAAKGW